MTDDRRKIADDEADEADEDIMMVDAPTETLEEILAEADADAQMEEKAAADAVAANLKKLDAELSEMRDRHLRKLAEFDNFKKRTERERSEFARYSLTDVLRDLLPVLDNFERALAQDSSEVSNEYRQGVELIYRQLYDTLKRRGLSEVPVTGGFDPNLHEAVAREEVAGAAPNTILAVLQKGYFLHDRLLRPAFVKVAASPAAGS